MGMGHVCLGTSDKESALTNRLNRVPIHHTSPINCLGRSYPVVSIYCEVEVDPAWSVPISTSACIQVPVILVGEGEEVEVEE